MVNNGHATVHTLIRIEPFDLPHIWLGQPLRQSDIRIVLLKTAGKFPQEILYEDPEYISTSKVILNPTERMLKNVTFFFYWGRAAQ